MILGDVTFSDLHMVVTDKRSNGIFVFGTRKRLTKLEELIKGSGYSITNG